MQHSGRSDGGGRAQRRERWGPLALARGAERPYRHQGAVPGSVHHSQPRHGRQVSHFFRLHVKTPSLLHAACSHHTHFALVYNMFKGYSEILHLIFNLIYISIYIIVLISNHVAYSYIPFLPGSLLGLSLPCLTPLYYIKMWCVSVKA